MLSGSTTVKSARVIVSEVSSRVVSGDCPVITGWSLTGFTVIVTVADWSLDAVPSWAWYVKLS